MTRLFAVFAICIALVTPTLAEPNNGGGSSGPTVGDLSKRGYVCTTFNSVYLACKDPSGNGPPYVCSPNGQCIPGDPQEVTSGGKKIHPPLATISLGAKQN